MIQGKEWPLPSQHFCRACSARIGQSSLQVRDTGTACGNGAFAVERIPQGTYLGNYEGELLGLDAYYERYPSGTVRPLSPTTGGGYLPHRHTAWVTRCEHTCGGLPTDVCW